MYFSGGGRRMIMSKQEKEAVKMGLPVFTVRTTHSLFYVAAC